jgi:glycosyltransferase involved in cell wall biosynthesis
MLARITPVILTFNEEPNIGRTLERLAWAPEIVVVDSYSSDKTLDIVRSVPQARLLQRRFDTHANQWNFAAFETGIASDWILALDADYVLTDAVIEEIRWLDADGPLDGYTVWFRYCVWGRPLHGTLYPPVTVLFRRKKGRFCQDGHTHRLKLEGTQRKLANPVLHDDRKSLAHWLAAQQRYARIEADHLLSSDRASLGWSNRVRLLGWPAPLLVFFYTLLAKGCLLDGWRGWLYVLQRVAAEIILALEIVDRRGQTSGAGPEWSGR